MSKYITGLPTAVFKTDASVEKVKALDFVAVAFRESGKTLFVVCFTQASDKIIAQQIEHCIATLAGIGVVIDGIVYSNDGAEFNFADGKNDLYIPPHLAKISSN